MPSSTSSSDRKPAGGYAGTLLSMLVTLICVAALAAVREGIAKTPINEGVDEARFWRDKILATGPYDLVIAGDSRAYRGIVPEAIAAETGMPVSRILNFGFSGCAFGPRYLTRLTQLQPGGSPRTVVLAISPGSLTPHSLQKNGFLDWEDRLGRIRSSGFARLKASITAPIENLAATSYLKPVSESTLRRILTSRTWKERVYRQVFMKTGWVASRAEPVDLGFYLDWFSQKFIDNQVSGEAVDRLLDWVSSSRARGVEVYGLRMPIGDTLRAQEERYSGMDWEGFVARFAEAGGFWLDFSGAPYATYDGSHLDEKAARAFSADLARRLDRKDGAQPAP